MPSLTNGTVKNHHQIPHGIEARHDQFWGRELELLILHKMVSGQDISLYVSVVPIWVIQLCYLVTLYPIHKLNSSVCGYF